MEYIEDKVLNKDWIEGNEASWKVSRAGEGYCVCNCQRLKWNLSLILIWWTEKSYIFLEEQN